jgi:hypothetical protein
MKDCHPCFDKQKGMSQGKYPSDVLHSVSNMVVNILIGIKHSFALYRNAMYIKPNVEKF